MKVKDLMTSPVLTVGLDTPLKEVAELLSDRRISGLPVVNESGRVVGVISEGDILYKERGVARERRGLLGLLLEGSAVEAQEKLRARTAGEAMTAPAVTVRPSLSVAEAAALMLDEHVKRLPVVDEHDSLVGIVTRADLVRAFVRSDAEIAQEIREDVVLRSLWIAPERVTVTVEDGEVTLLGQVETQAEAELLPQFAQRVPGVVSVLSRLTWEVGNGEYRNDRKLEWTTDSR
jgi:CBS domain-containing protein